MISATEAKQATLKVNEEAKERFRLIIETTITKMINDAVKVGVFKIAFVDRHVGVPSHQGKIFAFQLQKSLGNEHGYSVQASSPRSPSEAWSYSVSWEK
jgi:hypothetical protein